MSPVSYSFFSFLCNLFSQSVLSLSLTLMSLCWLQCCLLATLHHGPGLKMVLVSSQCWEDEQQTPARPDQRRYAEPHREEEGKPVLRRLSPDSAEILLWAASLRSISEWRGASSMQSATLSQSLGIFGWCKPLQLDTRRHSVHISSQQKICIQNIFVTSNCFFESLFCERTWNTM